MNLKLIRSLTGARLAAVFGMLSLMPLAGCNSGTNDNAPRASAGSPGQKGAADAKQGAEDADIKAERAKLSAEDQALVAAQEFCAISTGERLGAMGPPVKIIIKGQPVFLCCGGCEKSALRNPEKTLATLQRLTVKAAAPQP